MERLFGTLQDRLCSELRLADATTIEAANQALEAFLPEYNRHFTVGAAEAGSAYRPLPAEIKPEQVFCFKYERTVGMDNTVRLGEHRIQILPGPRRRSYARARVEIHEHLDGSLAVYYQGEMIATQEVPPEAPKLRARSGRLDPARLNPSKAVNPEPGPDTTVGDDGDKRPKAPYKPGPDHPWKRAFKPPLTNSLNS